MVRLVFRPYTQVWRSICTLESLRASTRVSPGFTLLKHSSPSFGSYQICSYSNLSQKIMVGRCCRHETYLTPWHLILTFIKPMSFCTRKLAYVIDSLVRVSRRVSRSRCGRTYFLRPPCRFRKVHTVNRGLHLSWFRQELDLVLPFSYEITRKCHYFVVGSQWRT